MTGESSVNAGNILGPDQELNTCGNPTFNCKIPTALQGFLQC